MINIAIEKIIIGNNQLAQDVPGRPRTSPEGPLKVLTSETYKGPSGDSQKTYTKIDDFIKKIFFRSNSPCIISVFLFLQEVAGLPWDQMMGRSKYARGTSVKHVF